MRIDPGKSWTFTYPSTPPERTYSRGPLPSLSALLPGAHVAEFGYAVREDVERARLAGNVVYAPSAGALAGKRPKKLWTGVVRAEPVKFDVVDDGSPQLAILRDVHAGKGVDKLRLEMRKVKGPTGSQALRLRLVNTGDQPIYLGSRFGLVSKDPDGRTHPDFNGPRNSRAMALAPNSHRDVGGWSFNLTARKPGLYTVWATYQSMGIDGKLLAKSNEIRLQVPAATPPALKATLPCGVEVELVGIAKGEWGKRTDARGPWWRPDGTALAKLPKGQLRGGWSSNRKREVPQQHYKILARLTWPEGVDKRIGGRGWPRVSVEPIMQPWDGARQSTGTTPPPKDYLHVIGITIPKSENTATVSFRVPAKPWVTVAS
ncbi:hypothetical protein LCGC14_2138750, partial [marine sediment metagenome]